METIKITTSQNIEIDYEVAGLGERIVARLIDFGIFILILIAGGIIAALSGSVMERIRIFGYAFVGLYIAWLVSLVFYDLVCEVFLNGQSVGKRIMKIKVISLDGARASLGQYIIRWLFRIVDFLITFQLAALIAVIVTKNKQRIGDLAAGTTLVSTKSRTNVNQIAFAPVLPDYVPVFKEVNQLTDRDIVLIHEVIQNNNPVLIHNMANQIKTHLSVVSSFDDLRFLQTIMHDYNFIMAKMEL
ncbi:RDD family protein [Mucilaginibacter arboris]|uniref:RDD family protein n=1 Tax=Mucilaginibacter arboris TaxID=2682090 RepID=A0A7K1SV58_9SPHI|nr:RDD family protein [Mucilaginibacter arboris]MVN21205.1 RDD family protein [Mucilaginibacter arboris]